MATMVKVTCACGCGKTFEARAADVQRGWGKYYNKSHKAVAQERSTGQHAAHKARMHRIDEDDIDSEGPGWDAHKDQLALFVCSFVPCYNSYTQTNKGTNHVNS